MVGSRTVTATALILACVLSRPARAIWVETQLTPTTLTQTNLAFKVECHDVGAQKQFDITITPSKDGALSPVLTGTLDLVDETGEAVMVMLHEERSRNRVSYWFRVSPRYVARSKFTFGVHGYARVPGDREQDRVDEWSRPLYIGLPGGRGYWMKLADFAGGGSKVKGEGQK